MIHSHPPDDDGVCLDISAESAGWEYTGLVVRRLEQGGTVEMATGRDELAVLLLGGDCTVATAEGEFRLDSRSSTFDGPPSAVYLPIDTSFSIAAKAPSEIAFCASRAEEAFPVRFIGPDDVAIEIRGAGNAARQINH